MMDVTEYWATLISIVIGLGFADLLLNLLRLIHERKRVDWDGLPLMWALVALAWMLNYWWGVAAGLDGSRDMQVVGQFAILFTQPILLFMMSASVLPRVMPAEGRLNMREAWADVRLTVITLFAVNQALTWARIIVAGEALDWDYADTIRTTVLGILVVLLLVKDRRVEWVGVLVIFGLIAFRLAGQPVR